MLFGVLVDLMTDMSQKGGGTPIFWPFLTFFWSKMTRSDERAESPIAEGYRRDLFAVFSLFVRQKGPNR